MLSEQNVGFDAGSLVTKAEEIDDLLQTEDYSLNVVAVRQLLTQRVAYATLSSSKPLHVSMCLKWH